MQMKDTIQSKIEDLKGTCNTIDLDDFTFEELELLDEEIFQCSTCSWWCDIDEEVGEGTSLLCKDCKDEE